VLHVLERDFGMTLPRWLQIDFSRVVQGATETQGGELSPDAIRELFERTYVTGGQRARLSDYRLDRHDGRVQIRANIDGALLEGEGEGAVAALLAGIATRHGIVGAIEAFDEFALDTGSDAPAMACVKLRAGDTLRVGVAFARDTTSAALQAVLNALPAALITATHPGDARGSVAAPAA
jgi:2-isopropylmalate synthase